MTGIEVRTTSTVGFPNAGKTVSVSILARVKNERRSFSMLVHVRCHGLVVLVPKTLLYLTLALDVLPSLLSLHVSQNPHVVISTYRLGRKRKHRELWLSCLPPNTKNPFPLPNRLSFLPFHSCFNLLTVAFSRFGAMCNNTYLLPKPKATSADYVLLITRCPTSLGSAALR